MKQLEAKTILAIGLPGSLLANILIAGLIFSVFGPEFVDWRIATGILGGSVWLLLSVPVFVGMALIRNRIGKFNSKRLEILAAIKCCSLCFVIAVLGIGGGYYFREKLIYELPIVGAVSFLIGTICVALVVFTCINILIRFFAGNQQMESRAG